MDLLGEQRTSRHRHPAITWHAPHCTDQRQRPEDQLHDRCFTVLLAPAGVDSDDPPLPRIIDTGIGHHRLRSLLYAYHIVIHPDRYRVAPQALIDIDAKVVQPNVAILPDRARHLAEA